MSPATIVYRLLQRTALAIGLPLTILVLPTAAGAAPPLPGEFVMVTWPATGSVCCQVLVLNAEALSATEITSGGHLLDPFDIAVSAAGDIYVTDATSGVVRVDAASGAQAIFASVPSLGGTPAGIVVDAEALYVSLRGSPASIVQLDGRGEVQRVVSSGGLLQYPGGLAIGPDRALYVCETIPTGASPGGGLVRVDLGSGGQALVSDASPLHGPFDAAFAPDGSLWSIQRSNRLHEPRGVLVRTQSASGESEWLPTGFDYLSGVAIRSDGLVLVADCYPVHGDCFGSFVRAYPDGPQFSWSRGGPIAVVPEATTRSRTPTWGQIKLIYR